MHEYIYTHFGSLTCFDTELNYKNDKLLTALPWLKLFLKFGFDEEKQLMK